MRTPGNASYYSLALFTITPLKAKKMNIIAKCPYCANAWLLTPNAADRRITCTKCKNLFKVPNLNELPKALKIIKQAKSKIYVNKTGNTYA